MKPICAFHAHISVRIKGGLTDALAVVGKGCGSTLATTASFRSGRFALLGIRDLAIPGAGTHPWLTAVFKTKNKTNPTTIKIKNLAPGLSLCPVGGVEIVWFLDIWVSFFLEFVSYLSC